MKRTALIVFSLFVVLFLSFSLNAQSAEWIRVESETKELSLAFPPDFVAYNNKKDPKETLKIYGFQNGVLFNLRIFKENNPKARLREINFSPGVKAGAFSKNKIDGKMSVVEKSGRNVIQNIYLASNKKFYQLQITAPSLKQAEVERFLLSIKLNGDPIFTGNNKHAEAAEIKTFESISTSPEIAEAMERKPEKRQPNVEYKKLSEAVSINTTVYSRPPIVLDTPHLKLNFGSGSTNSWLAKLRVELLANGQVGKITVYSDSSRSFAESCAEAMQNLKFIPAQINGKNVDSADILEYNIQSFVMKSVTIFE